MKQVKYSLTIEDKILLHLLQFHSYLEEVEVPFEISQPGIAEALHIRRSHVSYALKGLKMKGYVKEQISHIRNIIRKRKVYFLTAEGNDYARKLKNTFEQKTVIFIDNSGNESNQKLSDIIKDVSPKISFSQLLAQISPEGILDSAVLDRFREQLLEKRDKGPIDQKSVHYIDTMTKPARLIGRKKEIEGITNWIDSDLPRIVIIKGLPGIGKTTLAAGIINNYAKNGKHNLFWYKFHEWDTVRSTLTEIAEFLSHLGKKKLKFYLNGQTTINFPEILKIFESELQSLNAILVFDDFQKVSKNLNQLLSMFVELLDSGKITTFDILILTREAVGFYNRRDVALKKLVSELELGGLSSTESKLLLNLNNIDESEFKKIFNLTEGHPLTLELIKIHMSSKSKDITSQLNIGELFKGHHDVNRYLQEEIFSNLSLTEKKLLDMVSIFRYPVPSEAFFIDSEITHECIDSLTNRSLIHETSAGYDIHELIKEFFYRRLTPQAKINYHQNAANFYSSELQISDSSDSFDATQSAFEALEAQYHYLRSDNFENAALLASEHGSALIGKGYTEELLKIINELIQKKISNKILAELLIHKGYILTVTGEWDDAMKCYLDSLNTCKDNNDQQGLARAYNAVGVIHYRKGDWKEAMEHYNLGLKFAEAENDNLNCSKLYSNIALVHWQTGALKQAVDFIKKSLALSEGLNDKQGIARAYNNLGIIYWEQRKLDNAIDAYDKSLKLSEMLGDVRTIAILYDNLGEAYRLKGQEKLALEFYKKSLKLSEELGFKWQIAEVNCNLGILFKDTNKKRSKEYLNLALELYETLGAKREVEKVKEILGEK